MSWLQRKEEQLAGTGDGYGCMGRTTYVRTWKEQIKVVILLAQREKSFVRWIVTS
jgi:hypothetical protein